MNKVTVGEYDMGNASNFWLTPGRHAQGSMRDPWGKTQRKRSANFRTSPEAVRQLDTSVVLKLWSIFFPCRIRFSWGIRSKSVKTLVPTWATLYGCGTEHHPAPSLTTSYSGHLGDEELNARKNQQLSLYTQGMRETNAWCRTPSEKVKVDL